MDVNRRIGNVVMGWSIRQIIFIHIVGRGRTLSGAVRIDAKLAVGAWRGRKGSMDE